MTRCADGKRLQSPAGRYGRLAAGMLAQLLQQRGCAAWDLKLDGSSTGSEEDLRAIEGYRPDVVCISALPPFAVLHARTVSKRLRARFPDLKIIVLSSFWAAEMRSQKEWPGVFVILPKPFLSESLVDSVRGALGRSTESRVTR